MEELNPTKINSLKQLIDQHLRSNNVYAQIRQFIVEYSKENNRNDDNVGEEQKTVFDSLREKKIIEKVIDSFKLSNELIATRENKVDDANKGVNNDLTSLSTNSGSGSSIGIESLDPGKVYLLIKVLPGRAFVNEFQDEVGSKDKFLLRLHVGKQRFESKLVQCSEEPDFDESFLIDLGKTIFNKNDNMLSLASARSLLSNSKLPLHFVLLRVSPGVDGHKEVVASHELEWRRILARNGGASVAIDLMSSGLDSKSKLSIGILDLLIDIVPTALPNDAGKPLISISEVNNQLRAETVQEADAHRRFCQYARKWWQEYVEINPSFRHRLVKIFAENEWNEHRATCSFITPMKAGRQIDTPYEACRFVALLPYTRDEAIGGGRLEVWHTLHTFLSVGKGDCEDHSVLLCSLLLGFGLNAYICVGTVIDLNKERDHIWVCTINGTNEVTFWESLTGQRIKNPHLKPVHNESSHSYHRIACIMNHESFYANKQRDDRVLSANFNLMDDLRWKSMDERLIKALKHQRPVPLIPAATNINLLSENIEVSLRALISSHRASKLELGTQFDEDLCYYLSSALKAYEVERIAGISYGNEEFQASIKQHVPKGHSFKGFPIMFDHRSPQRMLESLLSHSAASDILTTRGDHVHFALRVKSFSFPENIHAIWVMIAVRYRAS